MNKERKSKSSAPNPPFIDGMGTCRNEEVGKHREILICLSNSCAVSDTSKLAQARRSSDSNSLMKLTSYNSHRICQTTSSGGNTPGGYSLPCHTIGPIEPLRIFTPGYISDVGINMAKLS